MDTTKHTPGPWRAEWGIRADAGREEQWQIVAPDAEVNGPVADLSCSDDSREYPEIRANAYLMAAAPDLLLACRAAMQALRATSQADKDYSHELRLIRAALAKAAGRKHP